MIQVTCSVKTYDEKDIIMINSHLNDDERVYIVIDDKSYEIIGKDIIKAIRNCMEIAKD